MFWLGLDKIELMIQKLPNLLVSLKILRFKLWSSLNFSYRKGTDVFLEWSNSESYEVTAAGQNS